jgi:hypothetical protein
MLIRTTDGTSLLNVAHVVRFSIEPSGRRGAQVLAELTQGEMVCVGDYAEPEHALTALSTIAGALNSKAGCIDLHKQQRKREKAAST